MVEDIGKHYIYRHIRLDDGTPFYIGIGTRQSYEMPNHLRKERRHIRAYSLTQRTEFWKSIVTKAGYEVEILVESNDYEFILKRKLNL